MSDSCSNNKNDCDAAQHPAREATSTGFRFTVPEFVGSLADLGTLLPLLVGLIVVNGIKAGPAIGLVGVSYILTGLYYRIPVPVQPLKAAAMIAIATGASTGQIRAAALWMAGIMLFLALTKLADKLNSIFSQVLIHGMQFALGIIMVRSGFAFIITYPTALGASVHPASTAAQHGLVAGFLPSGADFAAALLLLVLPQIPLTIGNSVIATRDCARKYFGDKGDRVTAGRLSTTISLGNLAAGLVGGMPMCHGAGGMTAHYCFGARTGAAGVMIGTLFLVLGATAGGSAADWLMAVPAWVLGALLAYTGVRHAMLAKESLQAFVNAMVVLSMGAATWFFGSLLVALGAGLAVKALLQYGPRAIRRVWAG